MTTPTSCPASGTPAIDCLEPAEFMQLIIQRGNDWLAFREPVEILRARTRDEVFQCLEKIEKSRCWAAGFVTYEAAGVLDEAHRTHAPGELPLMCFGLYETVQKIHAPESDGTYQLGTWSPSVTRDEYVDAIARIKEHIAAGDSYQVNYTFRLNAAFDGDPFAFFCDLAAAQQGGFGAYIEADDFTICSASPELFFELHSGMIRARPMKGTRSRGLTVEQDRAAAHDLQEADKDRAENIMIVDMIRNDIGRIAVPGSVHTESRFDVEKYPTVWQMTSTVSGETRARISNVWKNLFPCASITGAPKARTMEIIQALEKSPRGVYTGAVGFVAPDGSAQFNVAIRTAVIDRSAGTAEYGIGGGIVWDSDPDSEYDEALSKAAILTRQVPDFQCLETMLWENGGVFLLQRHLTRLQNTAEYFDFQWDPAIERELEQMAFDRPVMIRLLLRKDGSHEFQTLEIPPAAGEVRLALAKTPVDLQNVFLYHKTTHRSVYEKAKNDFPEADDVLLYNERGEVTESCIANIVVELDGRKVTPPVSCGLLAGTFRDELLLRGDIEEGLVALEDLKRADTIFLINSVRKWRPAVLI
ncbi:aminodeoxychorismate synthase component I [Tichowtungia aerotolerans]|uniref:Aminodeoxychorismate synthase component I n=1 Tax=Tichowtungia aerotolerans TaxID=2697043 RepID=A0A6P1M196_9BACT|nr:aminodeoxychorismate synthase component I [Tichowtungia aerotolerans]QHI68350.1 aminodeoxychorismate synthase component I [Tichowtungia aerotolerans]